MKTEGPWSSITAICPTYGRHTRLRDAIACFLLQDYCGYKQLSILNDAPTPLRLLPNGDNELIVDDSTKIVLVNAKKRFPNFGQKKQALADSVETDLIAHWDDDDLALPWYLSTNIKVLKEHPEFECVKPPWAWYIRGVQNDVWIKCAVNRRFDGLMIFKRGTAVKYKNSMRQSAVPLLHDYVARGTIHCLRDTSPVIEDISYGFRKGDDLRHLSRSGNNKTARRHFARRNEDFGNGEALLPADGLHDWALEQMRVQFLQIISGIKDVKFKSNTTGWIMFIREFRNKRITTKQVDDYFSKLILESKAFDKACKRLSAILRGD